MQICSMMFCAVICCDVYLCSITAMPTKIYIGKLPEGISSEDIRALFRKFGAITECDVLSNYGFVVSTATPARIFITVCNVIFVISALYVIMHGLYS